MVEVAIISLTQGELDAIIAGGSSEGIGTIVKDNFSMFMVPFEGDYLEVENLWYPVALKVFPAGTNDVKLYYVV